MAVRTCLAGDHLVNGLHPGLVAVLIDQERRGSLSRRRSTGEGEGGATIVLLRQATPGRIVTIILIASARLPPDFLPRLPMVTHW